MRGFSFCGACLSVRLFLIDNPPPPSPRRITHLDEDAYCELVKYGNLLEMHVCDNVGDHLIGNVYARFDWEDEAQRAVEELNKRWYAGQSPGLSLVF